MFRFLTHTHASRRIQLLLQTTTTSSSIPILKTPSLLQSTKTNNNNISSQSENNDDPNEFLRQYRQSQKLKNIGKGKIPDQNSKTKRVLKMLNIPPIELQRLRHNMRKAGFRSKRSPRNINLSWTLLQQNMKHDHHSAETLNQNNNNKTLEEPTLRELLLLKQRADSRNKLNAIPMKVLQEKKKARHYSNEFNMEFYFKESDIEEGSCLGRGPGGQATNRRMQTAQIRHIPSGISMKLSKFRSLYANRKAVRVMLSQKLEQLMFGEYSRLGGKMKKDMIRRKRCQQRRQRLEKAARRLEEENKNNKKKQIGTDGGHHAQNLEFSSSSFSPFYAQPSSSLSDLAFDKDKLKQCWKCLNFYYLPAATLNSSSGKNNHINTNNGNQQAFEAMCNETGLVVDFDEKVQHGPELRKDLLQSPFVENWYKILESSYRNSSHQQDMEIISGSCSCVPFWFLTIFPSLPTTTKNFIGPTSSWECRERSYLKNEMTKMKKNQSDDDEQIIIAPYRHFFEMWGMRLMVLEKDNNKSSKNVDTIIIDRDEGLNWIEGRNKILDSEEMFSLLWRHVLNSATEMEHQTIVDAMKVFCEKRTNPEFERHEGVRNLFGKFFVRTQ